MRFILAPVGCLSSSFLIAEARIGKSLTYALALSGCGNCLLSVSFVCNLKSDGQTDAQHDSTRLCVLLRVGYPTHDDIHKPP